jgi:glucosamine--fructose-6-phosphate aminotransferase (isomerizing)
MMSENTLNDDDLRDALVRDGYVFSSDTDTEVIVHLIHQLSPHYADLRSTVHAVTQHLQGAYGMVVADS